MTTDDAATRWEDPIVAETRAARASLLASVAGDVEGLAQRLRAEQAASGREVVTLPPRPPHSAAGQAA